MEGPIFILGVHKSGTSLLRNLLDGHPAVYTVPLESHYPTCAGLPSQYPRRATWGEYPATRKGIIARMLAVVEEYQYAADKRADAYLPGRFDMTVLQEHLEAHITVEGTHATRWWHYLEAIHRALHGEPLPAGRRIVEKSVDNLEHAPWLLQHFPDARFVLILRNPYANLHSFGRFVSRKGRFPSLSQPLRTIELGFHLAAVYRATMPQVHIIRYEDLLATPRPVMEGIARHLDLAWDDRLLIPTTMGKDWEGNSSSGEQLHGIQAGQADRWKERISAIEVELVGRSRLRERMEAEGYAPMDVAPSWWPEEGTSLRTYVRNRLFRLFADGS